MGGGDTSVIWRGEGWTFGIGIEVGGSVGGGGCKSKERVSILSQTHSHQFLGVLALKIIQDDRSSEDIRVGNILATICNLLLINFLLIFGYVSFSISASEIMSVGN